MLDETLQWLGARRNDVRAFPRDARRLTGIQLRRVQQGLDPLDWRPMPSVGPGDREIRVHTALEHCVLYFAKFAEAVYVLQAFEKCTRKSAIRDVDLARQRFRALVGQRRTGSLTGG